MLAIKSQRRLKNNSAGFGSRFCQRLNADVWTISFQTSAFKCRQMVTEKVFFRLTRVSTFECHRPPRVAEVGLFQVAEVPTNMYDYPIPHFKAIFVALMSIFVWNGICHWPRICKGCMIADLNTGVDFINSFAPLCPTFEKLFTGAKVWRKAQKFGIGRKTVYEIDPRSANLLNLLFRCPMYYNCNLSN